MSAKNEITGKDVVTVSTTQTNASSVVTITAPPNTNNATIFIAGIILSASGAVAAAVAVTLTGVVGGTLTLQLPASAIAPVVLLFGVRPLKITPGVNAVLTLPALGSGIIGTATLMYYIGAP